jgi:branched-chain amino acid transport system ATP-binding protein
MSADNALLRLTGVTRHFGGLKVIEDLGFEVRRGERLGLIGPNGAGKTTTFNLVSGIYRVDSGTIVMDGVDLTNLPCRERIRHGIARSFQNIRLMPHLAAFENVMFGQCWRARGLRGILQPVRMMPRNRWREEARVALDEAGLSAYTNARVGNLPYGIQKRIDLVRALMAKPKLLMLDEPTAGLNPTETDALRVQLERVTESGVALLVIEHDMPFIGALCDRTVVLNFGRKIAEGAPHEVCMVREVRDAYLGGDVEAMVPDHAS